MQCTPAFTANAAAVCNSTQLAGTGPGTGTLRMRTLTSGCTPAGTKAQRCNEQRCVVRRFVWGSHFGRTLSGAALPGPLQWQMHDAQWLIAASVGRALSQSQQGLDAVGVQCVATGRISEFSIGFFSLLSGSGVGCNCAGEHAVLGATAGRYGPALGGADAGLSSYSGYSGLLKGYSADAGLSWQ